MHNLRISCRLISDGLGVAGRYSVLQRHECAVEALGLEWLQAKRADLIGAEVQQVSHLSACVRACARVCTGVCTGA